MSDKIFIDSNLFLYSLDLHDKNKNTQSKELLLEVGSKNRLFISTQVINEIYAVATRKLGIDPLSVKEFIRGLYDFDVVIITQEIIESAIDCSILNRLNYWDALMIAAAETSKCSMLWTEDMQHGSVIRGVRINNPFLTQED